LKQTGAPKKFIINIRVINGYYNKKRGHLRPLFLFGVYNPKKLLYVEMHHEFEILKISISISQKIRVVSTVL
jgi:hypothetical protein